MLAPDNAAEYGKSPRHIVASNSKREEGRGSGGGNQTEKSENGGEEDAAPDTAEGDIPQ